MGMVTVGIDLAKNIFAVHGVDAKGKATLVRPSVPRAKLGELIAALPPCLIGMEACSGAHQSAREFAKFGHTVRRMAPKFVAPYRMRGRISRAGDSYLRSLLILGGKAVLAAAKNKTDPVSRWALEL